MSAREYSYAVELAAIVAWIVAIAMGAMFIGGLR